MYLNESQAQVVAAREPRLLVLAGAGTGKTATSVHWVADLIKGGTPRTAVLMITFTRKAAAEMETRVEKLIAHVPRKTEKDKLWVGTYHAIASLLLRSDAVGFGLLNNSFSTLDDSESESVWKSALKQCGLSTKSSLWVPGRLQQIYSYTRNTCSDLKEQLTKEFAGDGPLIYRVIKHYEELKTAANVVDYDDLLVRWAGRMEREPEYAERLRTRWRYVLVDEMQDNNRLNQRIIDALNPQHLLVVGDANQSVYGFRGADVQLITDFTTRYRDAKVLKLECNYRSGQVILDLANEVVSKTAAALHLRSAHEKESSIEYRCYLNPQDEAYAVVEWVQDRILMRKKPCESAILSRSSRALQLIEIGLNMHHIRYKKYGGQTIADAAEVKDFISFLRVAHNSHDKLALLRSLMQFPGIGEGTAAKAIAAKDDGLFAETLWPRPAAEMPEWIDALRQARTLGEKGKLLQDQIRPLILANYPKDGEERLGTINALVNAMQTMDGNLVDFLDGFTLSRHTNHFHPDDCVILSTIHSSKGLEWDGVWLLGVGSSQFPHPRAQLEHEIEEERRLFYVAVTRARHNLVASYPNTNDRNVIQQPTQFIPEKAPWKYPNGRAWGSYESVSNPIILKKEPKKKKFFGGGMKGTNFSRR